MKNCSYEIKIRDNDGEKIVKFNSELELDQFLREWEQGSSWVKEVNSPNMVFSISPQQQTLSKLDEITQVTRTRRVNRPNNIIVGDSEYADEETEVTLEKTRGTLEAITILPQPNKPDKPLSPKFDEPGYKARRIQEFLNKGWASNETEAQALYDSEVKSWDLYTQAGTEIHNIFESVITGKQELSRTIISEDLANKVRKQVVDFINKIKNKYGNDCKILSEFSIMSKELDPIVKTILKGEDDIDAISGKIDMLIIDKNGRAHLYDFKVSRKEPGVWNETNNMNISNDFWCSGKKNGIAYQMAFYNAILRQYGITISDVNIVPIKTTVKYADPNNINAIEITDAKVLPEISNIPGVLSGKFLENAMAYIPSSPGFKELLKVSEKFQKLFPSQSISTQVRHFVADVNYYKNKSKFVKLVNKEDTEHYGRYKYKFWPEGIKGQRGFIYCVDEADRDAKLEEYVSKLNDKNGIELSQLGKDIKDAIDGKKKLEEISESFTLPQQDFINNHFEHYIKNKWFFHQNEDLNAMGVFVFSKNGRSEIVMLTEKPIHEVVKLMKGSSIMGDFYDDSHWDRTRWLSASNGNFKLMQALCYVSENQEYFIANPVSEIRTINPWHRMEISALNSQILDNFDRLNVEQKAGIDLNQRCFQDDVEGLIAMADEKFKILHLNTSFCIKEDAINQAYTKEWILDKIQNLRRTAKNLNNSEDYNANDPGWQALTYLTKAYMKLLGYMTYNENDPGNWLNKGWQLIGLMSSSGQNAPSANMRMLYKLIYNYSTDVRQETLKTLAPVQKAFIEFYKEKGQNKLTGGEYKFFEEWFEKDADGKISKSFTLVDPEDPTVPLSEKSRRALKMFLDTIAYLRYPDKSPEDIDNYKTTESYRQVPILERRFGRRLTKNPLAALKMWFKKNMSLYENVFGGEDGEKQNWFDNDLDQENVYNHFVTYESEVKRNEAINELGVDGLETDLERVLTHAVSAYKRAEVSRRYLPAINGFKLGMKYMMQYQNNNLQNTYNAMLKAINKKIYGNPIMEKQLQGFYQVLSPIRSIFTGMTLGLSSKAFARELLQGAWTGLSRSTVEQLEGMNFENYCKAFGMVAQDAWKNKDLTNKLPQLNSLYGMANYSLNDIADQQRLNWYGIQNWGTDTLYITSSAPDFQHRLTVLISKMLGDGCFEASTQTDENGNLYYDFNKDERYKIYLSGDTSNPQYIYQRALYLENLRQFNEEGGKRDHKGEPTGELFVEGDALPRAYTNRQVLQIKNYADLLYGHYDMESKALINDTFLGSFFMQFRTWAVAGIERWFLSPGVYNGEEPKVQKTADGEEIWYYYEDDVDGQTNLKRKVVRKSEVPQEIMDAKQAAPLMQFEGNPMEGILFSALRFSKALFTWNMNDLKACWDNPLYRKNLLLGIWDMFIMSMFVVIFKLLLNLITGEDLQNNLTSQNWITQLTYGALTGSTQDGQIHQLLGTMFTDLNPPLMGQLQQFGESCWGVITGDDNIAYAITRNIGAVREFQGLAKNLTA